MLWRASRVFSSCCIDHIHVDCTFVPRQPTPAVKSFLCYTASNDMLSISTRSGDLDQEMHQRELVHRQAEHILQATAFLPLHYILQIESFCHIRP